MRFLFNHLGFRTAGPKRALLQAAAPIGPTPFVVVEVDGARVVFEGVTAPVPGVPGWRGRHFAEARFDALASPGEYHFALAGAWPPVVSAPFVVAAEPVGSQQLSDLVHFFKSQRCTGVFDAADHAAAVVGSDARRDVHGGWVDASGDCSKYLSHLSYADTMNPQQTPLVVWSLLAGRARLPSPSAWFDERVVDEALHGADFLVRMQRDDGLFHATVFDRWSKDPAQRVLGVFSTQRGVVAPDPGAAFRQGGGMAIAALARAAGAPRDGGFARAAYLVAATRAFDTLADRPASLLPDGRENLLDHACALLAAAELWAATGDGRWRTAAGARLAALSGLQDDAGQWWFHADRTRSFHHASDTGLPPVALARALEAGAFADASLARQLLARGLRRELALAAAPPNPFGLPRHHVAVPGRPSADRFFFPHDNPSGYWWQGENARLASLATAARLGAGLHLGDAAFDAALLAHADRCLDWILGANPFDACMVQGWGRHAPRYEPGYWNAPGGVCNGITAGLDDEDDLDFRPAAEAGPAHSWRWTEQWLPHAAWLFCALAHGPLAVEAPHAAFAQPR